MQNIAIRHANPGQTSVADRRSGETETEIGIGTGTGIENVGGP